MEKRRGFTVSADSGLPEMDSHCNYNFPDGLSIRAFASPSAAGDDNEMPAQNIGDYGIAGRIWEAAYDLQQYFRPPDYLQMDPPCSFCSVTSGERKTVIELGSGTGVGGLSAASVLQPEDLLVLTDLAAVLPLLEINLGRDVARRAEAEKSAGEVWIRALPWGDTHAAEAVLSELRECGRNITQILCSDLVYFPALLAPLLRSLIEITSWSADVEVIISCRLRDPIKETPFWSAFGAWFEFTPVLAKDLREGPGARWGRYGGQGETWIFIARRRRDSVLRNIFGYTDSELLSLCDSAFEMLLQMDLGD